MTPRLPPRVPIWDRNPVAGGAVTSSWLRGPTRVRTGKSLAVGPEDKPHTSTQLAMVPAGLLESSSASPPQGRTADPRTTPTRAALSPPRSPWSPRQTLRSTTPVEPLRSGHHSRARTGPAGASIGTLRLQRRTRSGITVKSPVSYQVPPPAPPLFPGSESSTPAGPPQPVPPNSALQLRGS